MAKGIFKKDYDLRTCDFDRFRKLKPSAVLDLFQDAASLHAEELGIGFESMLKRDLLWVIMKVKYQLVRQPHMYQRVTVVTWPREARRLDFERNYLVIDEKGQTLVKGTSQWAVINSETRKLMLVKDMYAAIDEFCCDTVFDEKLLRVQDFSVDKPACTVKSGFCELDSNGHVNNIRYADYVINALAPRKPMEIKMFQIDFHKEIKFEDKTDIYICPNENTVLAKGMQGDDIMFSCKIEGEEL